MKIATVLIVAVILAVFQTPAWATAITKEPGNLRGARQAQTTHTKASAKAVGRDTWASAIKGKSTQPQKAKISNKSVQ